jgi:putative SbcD/Mre11-related phosphoesterase
MSKINIFEFEVIDRCLFWKIKNTLIAGDLHLGYEQSLNERGISVIRDQLNQTKEIFERIFTKIGRVERIILLGDIKHQLGGILKQELQDFEELVLFFNKYLIKDGKIIITKGNHDNILEPIIKNHPNVVLLDGLSEQGIIFLHGDSQSVKKNYEKIKNEKTKLVVLGHFHPAYLLKDKKSIKEEKYKCFLYGKSSEYGKNVIFAPSFFPLIEGSDIIKDLEIYEKGMKVVLVADDGKVYNFGKI